MTTFYHKKMIDSENKEASGVHNLIKKFLDLKKRSSSN
jgi:hypothetical protein